VNRNSRRTGWSRGAGAVGNTAIQKLSLALIAGRIVFDIVREFEPRCVSRRRIAMPGIIRFFHSRPKVLSRRCKGCVTRARTVARHRGCRREKPPARAQRRSPFGLVFRRDPAPAIEHPSRPARKDARAPHRTDAEASITRPSWLDFACAPTSAAALSGPSSTNDGTKQHLPSTTRVATQSPDFQCFVNQAAHAPHAWSDKDEPRRGLREEYRFRCTCERAEHQRIVAEDRDRRAPMKFAASADG